MKNLKKLVYDFFILILPVMLGVYLGLLANNWNEAKKEDQFTQKVLKNLIREVEYNRSTLEASLPYFEQLKDSIFHLQDKSRAIPSDFSFWQGLNPPLLKNSSYESASISGTLENLDLDLLEQLSTTYNLQEDLKVQTNTYISSVTNKIGMEGFSHERYFIVLENYAHDQISSEEWLLEELAKTRLLLLKNKDQ